MSVPSSQCYLLVLLTLIHHHSSTLNQLVEESGCSLEHPKAAVFRGHVLAGQWEEVNMFTSSIATSANIRKVMYSYMVSVLSFDSG